MGVLEFFGSLLKNNITSNAIKVNFNTQKNFDSLFLDFNSIIHVSSHKVTDDINIFLQSILKSLYEQRPLSQNILDNNFKKYHMTEIKSQITLESKPISVIKIFKDYFNKKRLNKLIIIDVIDTVKYILNTFCEKDKLKLLLIAIDGVPSKGKIIEQRQRRYLSAIIEKYQNNILESFKEYLKNQPDYTYYYNKYEIKWSTNNITPGTKFMNKLAEYLKNEKIQQSFKINQKHLKIIVSDMSEIGEGEKKIVNYINKKYTNSSDNIAVYSPDADVILLCMLLPVTHIFMIRHNQQTNFYDLIDIHLLKSNISYYINNNPKYAKENFDIEKINKDIVFISTLFGNDFVPKIETLNVKRGFQNIMDKYLITLVQYKSKDNYLINFVNDKYKLNFIFLKSFIKELLPIELDFIENNDLYNEFINAGQIKDTFSEMTITAQNIVGIYNDFMIEYNNFKNTLKNNGNYSYFEKNEFFMNSLRKSINIIIKDQPVNVTYLSNRELISLIKKFYQENQSFPKLNINLNTYSTSISDKYHKLKIKGFNEYQIESYKFKHMLDEYHIKFNAQPLKLSPSKLNNYYETYFGIKINNKKMSDEQKHIMHKYLEGIIWVFEYYYNDASYISRWYYEYERAPLLKDLYAFLTSIGLEYYDDIYKILDNYQIHDIKSYFNPLEQLIYVSPMIGNILKLIPKNYRQYITSKDLDPFLANLFIDISKIVENLWNEKKVDNIDCHNIMFFNKCIIKSIHKLTTSDDKLFMTQMRNIKPSELSLKLSKNIEPKF